VKPTVDTLFDEYAARWARGERPDAADYLDRAGKERAELAVLIDRYLAVAPASEPDEATVRFVELYEEDEPPLLAVRVARGLRREDVVAWILKSFGLPAEKEGKVSRYWHELEVGRRSPGDVAPELWRRVVELLGREAEAARSYAVIGQPAQPAFERREQTDFAPAPPAAAPARADDEADEVDRLFGYGAAPGLEDE
jgi:hypothetical protein